VPLSSNDSGAASKMTVGNNSRVGIVLDQFSNAAVDVASERNE
jgi:hypothetical protein